TQVLAATIEGCDPQSMTFQNLLNITWNCDKPMWKGVIDVLSEKIDITERMNEITIPALILHGDKDMVLPMTMAEQTHSLLPNSQLKVVEGHGHSYNMEDPAGFVKDVEAFWKSL
ncbi:MAG: alpha/beta hydrolase, partial [Bdellovibrionales bacterium]|nr:alpha/beta hydrolase [Bdellovibrionales bacterium]